MHQATRGTDHPSGAESRCPQTGITNIRRLPRSNGQAEGQINRLKTIKRAMYGRAGPELLRARMMPIKLAELHTSEEDPN
ncbi:MAG: hypothetical protein BGP09_21200 [Rhizobium sp. 60-20]|nr:MAG: hypothetical protein BGP09_21200 [Rhizobium sp. 60-20]